MAVITEIINTEIKGNWASVLPNDTLHYVNGSKQLQEPNGFNFAEFVPTLDEERPTKARFLSVFNRPTYFNGYPFSLSFIYSDNLSNKQLSRIEENQDINGVKSSQVATNLSVAGRGFVNRLMISGGYASPVKSVNVWINTGDATEQNETTGGGDLVEPGTVFDEYVEFVGIKIPDLSDWETDTFENRGNTRVLPSSSRTDFLNNR